MSLLAEMNTALSQSNPAALHKALAGDFTPGFSARLATKDLALAQSLGEHYGVPLATGAAAR